MSYITEFAKYVLFVLNFLISSCAIVMIIFGIMYYMEENEGVNVFSNIANGFSFGILAMCIGVIILFIAAFGCCGALHENTCLLTTYGVILIILFIIQLAAGILAMLKIVNEDDLLQYAKELLADMFDLNDSASRKIFYNIQTKFECCGVNNFADYNTTSSEYPASCCGRTLCYEPYEIGCAEAFTNAILKYIEIIGYVAIAFAVVELAGSIFSFLLRREKINNKFRGPKLEETSI